MAEIKYIIPKDGIFKGEELEIREITQFQGKAVYVTYTNIPDTILVFYEDEIELKGKT